MIGRLKFDLTDLANELINCIPEEVFVSKTTTFVDLAMGGGQFLKAVVNRLRKYGHSDDNIKTRIYGYENNMMRVAFTVNKNKLIGTFEEKTFDEIKQMTKKFDVVLGNPPYQNNHKKDGESKRKVGNKLWYQFMFKADNLVKQNGIVAMVTPTQWMSGGMQMRKGGLGILKDIFATKQLIVAKVSNITDVFFKGIGINIGYTVYKNADITQPTKLILKDSEVMINLKDVEFLTPEPTSESLSIVQKVLTAKNEKFNTYYFNGQSSPGALGETKEQTEKNTIPHWIMGSNVTNNLEVMFFSEKRNAKVNYKKILFPMSTRYWQPYLASKEINVATLGQALEVPDNTTQAGFQSVFYSKLFKYICFNLQINQNGFMKTTLVKALPKLDMSKVWTEDELYNHFNLTQEERSYIETNVK